MWLVLHLILVFQYLPNQFYQADDESRISISTKTWHSTMKSIRQYSPKSHARMKLLDPRASYLENISTTISLDLNNIKCNAVFGSVGTQPKFNFELMIRLDESVFSLNWTPYSIHFYMEWNLTLIRAGVGLHFIASSCPSRSSRRLFLTCFAYLFD